MNADHIIIVDEDDDRAHWECSCGRSGSSGRERVDAASDKHIGPGESRVVRIGGRR